MVAGVLRKGNLPAMTVHKFAGLKDGRFTNDNLKRMLLCPYDNNLKEVEQRIQETDCLTINEISMISANILQQLELVCRPLKKREDSGLVSGGIQLILCGDVTELAHVPNTEYMDNGQ